MYIFTNALGTHVFDTGFNLIETGDKSALTQKYPDFKEIEDLHHLNRVSMQFKKRSKEFYDYDILRTKKGISESVKDDGLVIQAIRTIDALDKAANALCKRVREWYSLYIPEASEFIEDNEGFITAIIKKDKAELIKELRVKDCMGSDLPKADTDQILVLASTIESLYVQKRENEVYIDSVMKKFCPNFLALTGALIGAKLLAQAGSFRSLMLMPASTVQLLGAEEALFRHIKTGSRPPKYGILLQHKIVNSVKKQEKGKVAKNIADKITIAVKVDYFKGDFIGDKLYEALKKKFS